MQIVERSLILSWPVQLPPKKLEEFEMSTRIKY